MSTVNQNFLPDTAPHNLEAERAVLGAIIRDAGEALPRVIEAKIMVEDFYKECHGEIFRAITHLYDRNEPVDLVTVSEVLKKLGTLGKIGGPAYLAELYDGIGLASNAHRYALMIKDQAVLRRLTSISMVISKGCRDTLKDTDDVDDMLDQAESAISRIRDDHRSQSLRQMSDMLPEIFYQIEALSSSQRKGLSGIPTGFTELDRLIGGFQRSDLIILAGRPGMGKTAMALNLALNVAVPEFRQQYKHSQTGVGVAIFSLEMATETLMQRLICQSGNFNLVDLRAGHLKPTELYKLTETITSLEKAKIFIDDTPSIRILELRAKVCNLKRQLNNQGAELGLIMVDYLQLMRGSGRNRFENRAQEISEISRTLKGLAKECKVSVLALSQLNRKIEDRADKRPQLADLRESGAIEQDADIIAFIYRPEVYNKDDESLVGKAELHIAKHRNGPSGIVNLRFLHPYTSFFPDDCQY